MSGAKYTERLSVGLTVEQVRRLDEIVRVRSRQGNILSKSDVLRDAVEFYFLHQDDLPGSRRAIAKSVEGKIAQVENKVDLLDTKVATFIAWLEARIRK